MELSMFLTQQGNCIKSARSHLSGYPKGQSYSARNFAEALAVRSCQAESAYEWRTRQDSTKKELILILKRRNLITESQRLQDWIVSSVQRTLLASVHCVVLFCNADAIQYCTVSIFVCACNVLNQCKREQLRNYTYLRKDILIVSTVGFPHDSRQSHRLDNELLSGRHHRTKFGETENVAQSSRPEQFTNREPRHQE